MDIEPGTRVYADGSNGRGVIFAYGNHHNIIQRGDVQALGNNGVAITFDFGNNIMGNEVDYRGSWIHIVNGNKYSLLPELEGALVDNADISGRVVGKAAALYISPNALVGNINILNGAQLEGDIYSDYNQRDDNGRKRLTQITFGRKANAYGVATDDADSGFSFAYRGNIEGINNLALNARGGKTSLDGNFHIYSVTIEPGAILSGNGRYTVNGEGRFVNNGILAPGNSLGTINIIGDYQQGDTGQLQLEFDGRGKHDALQISGHAQFNGQLTFVPLPDWYSSNWQQDSQYLLQTDSYSGEFNAVKSLLSSPTLTLQATPQGENSWLLSMSRSSNAYSRYAHDDNARQVGEALDKIVPEAKSGMQSLYRTLDFSAVDGLGISNALQQLSAGAYSAMFASSLHREQQITRTITGHSPVVLSKQLSEGEWRSFAIPFGGGFWQQRQGGSVGYDASSYGMVFGAEKQNEQDRKWIYGFHGAVSGQSVTVKSPESANGKSTAFDLGIHARYRVEQSEGMYLFGNGRFGIEDSHIERKIHLETYGATHRTNWTGFSGSLTIGGGYRWALNDNVNVGPVTSLNYNTLHRPAVKESGNDGSRLMLGSKTFNSLRSSIGVNSNWNLSLNSGGSIAAELQLTWEHELLDSNVVQQASFDNYRSMGFSTKNQVAGRDTMGAKAEMSYKINTDVELGIGIESELFRSGYDSLTGNLSATWRF